MGPLLKVRSVSRMLMNITQSAKGAEIVELVLPQAYTQKLFGTARI